MSSENKISRRGFLRGAAMTAVGALAASCAQPTAQIIEREVPVEKIVKETVIVEKQVPVEKVVKETVVVSKEIAIEKVVTATPVPLKFKEAPMLNELVRAGKLPPVDERLPEDPLVVPVVEKIGKYGGDWRMGSTGPADGAMYTRGIEYDHIARWDVENTGIIPDIATGWEVSSDVSEYTVYLRKGMKWSDGSPFTADDLEWRFIEFATEELGPGNARWRPGGELPVITKIDDFTIHYKFAAPNGFFQLDWPQPHAYELVQPSAYRKQFIPGYGDDAFIAAKTKEAGAENWYDAFGTWTDRRTIPEVPLIHAWMYTGVLGEDNPFIAVRNPYYYKVDPEGNQLPYIDRQVYTIGDRETLLLATIAGDIDYEYRHTIAISNKAFHAENLEKSGMRFVEALSVSGAQSVKLNLCHKDLVLREIFLNKDFRIALSHAINRQEIIDVVVLGLGYPIQCAPVPGFSYYDEEFATQYTEYDPDLANQILDGILPDKNAEGVRLRPDGQPLQFTFDVQSTSQSSIDMVELIKGYWAAVGVKMEPNVIQRALLYERFNANETDAVTWGSHVDLLDPGSMVTTQTGGPSKWANAWALWYQTDGAEGIEPPPAMQKNMETWKKIEQAPSIAAMIELLKEIIAVAKEEFWVMGTYQGTGQYYVAKQDFRNIPEPGISSWRYPSPGPYNTCQFFWDV